MTDPTDSTKTSDLTGGENIPPPAATEPPAFTGEHPPPRLVSPPPASVGQPTRGATRVHFDIPFDDYGRPSGTEPPYASVPGSSGVGGGTTSPPPQSSGRPDFGSDYGEHFTLGEEKGGFRAYSDPMGEFSLNSDKSTLYQYNVHEVEQELEDLGTEYVMRKYAKKIGPAKARKLIGLCSGMFIRSRGYEPPEMTLMGQEHLAELEASIKRKQPVIGGHGHYYQPERTRNFGIDHELAFEQELYLTYTRDQDNEPLYRKANAFEPCDEGGGEIYVNGFEKSFDGFLKDLHDSVTNPTMSLDEKLIALGKSTDPAARQRLLDDARNTDLKMDEVESKVMLVETPLLRANGDPLGEINDKTFRDIKGRLGDRVFNGHNDLTCVHYMEELRTFLQGRFNPNAAYAIMKATTAGEPYQYTADQQKTQVSFHYFWETFGKLFGTVEDPQIALAQLQDLRTERPTRLNSRLVKIQKLARSASYSVTGPTRLTEMVQLIRKEIFFMLGAWFPNHRKQILLIDKKHSARWRAERYALRLKGVNPDLAKLRSNYHPSNSLFMSVLIQLQDVEPEERPKGYIPRFSKGPVIKKNKRRPGVFEVEDHEGVGRGETREENEILNDYAESIADSFSDEEFSDAEIIYESDLDDDDDDPEVDALHQRPGEVMRRFQQVARPREPSQNRAGGRDRNREAVGNGGRPRPPRAGNERAPRQKLNEKFPNLDKGIVKRFCLNCLSRTHDWMYCGVYGGAVPVDQQRPCCLAYHEGPCKKDKVKEREADKQARAAERAKKNRD